MANDYNVTLNLPTTEFPMRANLPEREPEILENWQKNDLYNRLLENNKDKPLFILHDGPPYANGDIHIGHALNKILKDFIIKHKTMTGYKAPYIPGWDTHGLPIENQAIKKLGVNPSEVDPIKFREICRDFATGYAENQANQFKRLGVLADYEHPYYTLQNDFEAKQIEVFAEMLKRGYIYKGLKPVYWCPSDETALAEAEIEYADDVCDSIYVKFEVVHDNGVFANVTGVDKINFVIWTTTTWTLPGNIAVCVGPRYDYVLVKSGKEAYIVAKELLDNFIKMTGFENFEIIFEVKGKELEYMKVKHPFLDRLSLIIVGNHVTLESGTGCVHTAPGHGVEDFIVCQNYKQLEIIVPVDNKGRMTEEAGEKVAGLYYKKANEVIFEMLKESGHLLATERIVHPYPHCWRCKSPVIFRATEQWFCSVEGFRDEVLKAVRGVQWVPAWGEERISNMVIDRSDWCISRQRVWGVPIPIFYCEECNEPIVNSDTLKAVSELFQKEGSNAWYKYSAEEILGEYAVCKCGCKKLRKETDIMDVWFDSGVSHASVLAREGMRWPADVYLEGNDQYRGWFQSSLLTSVAWRGLAPYKTVVTHGFVVDGDGRKMSKSLGNNIVPADIIKDYGADILRLWVSSVDYTTDIRISKEILKQLSETYRKLRNTTRFILGNLGDFNPNTDMVDFANMEEIDRWSLIELNKLVEKVRSSYDRFEYHLIFHAVHNFCVVEMSNFYLDIIKDRMYVEKKASQKRRSGQTASYIIIDTLIKLIAPILAYTSEESWKFMPHKDSDNLESIFMNDMPSVNTEFSDEKLEEKYEIILSIREDVKKALEIARTAKVIGASLEAKVTVNFNDTAKTKYKGLYNLFVTESNNLNTAFITSQLVLSNTVANGAYNSVNFEGVTISVRRADGEKCERCWMYSTAVGNDSEHPTLCKRCADIMK